MPAERLGLLAAWPVMGSWEDETLGDWRLQAFAKPQANSGSTQQGRFSGLCAVAENTLNQAVSVAATYRPVKPPVIEPECVPWVCAPIRAAGWKHGKLGTRRNPFKTKPEPNLSTAHAPPKGPTSGAHAHGTRSGLSREVCPIDSPQGCSPLKYRGSSYGMCSVLKTAPSAWLWRSTSRYPAPCPK
jgi:hypothetical protein